MTVPCWRCDRNEASAAAGLKRQGEIELLLTLGIDSEVDYG